MSDERDPEDPASGPNVFDPAFLRRLRERDEPATANEAGFNDRWKAVPTPDGRWAVLREWESLESQDEPVLVADRRETALLACAVLPSLGREPLFHLGAERGERGYPLLAMRAEGGPQAVAQLSRFNAGLAATLHTGESMLRGAYELTCLMEAAGFAELELAGRLLYRRLAG